MRFLKNCEVVIVGTNPLAGSVLGQSVAEQMFAIGAPYRSRTCGLKIRSLALYPAELRARCISVLIGTREVFEPECRTPRQMQLANAFCRFLELSDSVA